MSDTVVIIGVKPYDGRYELDLVAQPLTTREWGWIKKHAGYLPLTLEADSFTDPEFVIVQAVIAVFRAGRVTAADVPGLVERFQDVDPFAAITYEAGKFEDEGDADPPPSSSDTKQSSNGDSSPTGSASLADPLSPTGSRVSDTSPSDPAMSAT